MSEAGTYLITPCAIEKRLNNDEVDPYVGCNSAMKITNTQLSHVYMGLDDAVFSKHSRHADNSLDLDILHDCLHLYICEDPFVLS